MLKITKATIKSFIKKNRDSLHIRIKDRFDGMNDCVMPVEGYGFMPAEFLAPDSHDFDYTLGIKDAFFVGGSTNYFRIYEDDKFKGYRVDNCCGMFLLVVRK